MKLAYFGSACGKIPVKIVSEHFAGDVHWATVRAYRGYLFQSWTHGGWVEVTEGNVQYECLQDVTVMELVEGLEPVLNSLAEQNELALREMDRASERDYVRTAGHPA